MSMAARALKTATKENAKAVKVAKQKKRRWHLLSLNKEGLLRELWDSGCFNMQRS